MSFRPRITFPITRNAPVRSRNAPAHLLRSLIQTPNHPGAELRRRSQILTPLPGRVQPRHREVVARARRVVVGGAGHHHPVLPVHRHPGGDVVVGLAGGAEILEVADRRRLSPGHLNRWYNLAGFCLRPGFGDPLDRFRVEQLWKLIYSPASKADARAAAAGQRVVPVTRLDRCARSRPAPGRPRPSEL